MPRPVILILALFSLAMVSGLLLRRLRSQRRANSSIYLVRLIIFSLGVILTGMLVFANILARQRADILIHPGRTLATETPGDYGIAVYQEANFLAGDGLRLSGWYVPTRNGAVVILLHGHASNRGQLLPEAALLYQQGFGVLLYDARNSGASQGNLTTLGLNEVEDVRGALAFVANQPGVDPQRIGLLGHSMGAATAILAAARYPQVSALVAESAYTSLEDNIGSGVRHLLNLPPFPFAPLVVFWGEWDSGMDISQVRPIDEVGRISPIPLLLIHGALDEIVPVENANRLYQAAKQPKALLILPQAGHDHLLETGGDVYRTRLLDFFSANLNEKK